MEKERFLRLYGPHRAIALLICIVTIPAIMKFPEWQPYIIGACLFSGLISWTISEYPEKKSGLDPLAWCLRLTATAISGVVLMIVCGYNAYQIFYHASNAERLFFPWFFGAILSGGVGLTYGWCALYHWGSGTTDGSPFE